MVVHSLYHFTFVYNVITDDSFYYTLLIVH